MGSYPPMLEFQINTAHAQVYPHSPTKQPVIGKHPANTALPSDPISLNLVPT